VGLFRGLCVFACGKSYEVFLGGEILHRLRTQHPYDLIHKGAGEELKWRCWNSWIMCNMHSTMQRDGTTRIPIRS
jgi:hypothetical protein